MVKKIINDKELRIVFYCFYLNTYLSTKIKFYLHKHFQLTYDKDKLEIV